VCCSDHRLNGTVLFEYIKELDSHIVWSSVQTLASIQLWQFPCRSVLVREVRWMFKSPAIMNDEAYVDVRSRRSKNSLKIKSDVAAAEPGWNTSITRIFAAEPVTSALTNSNVYCIRWTLLSCIVKSCGNGVILCYQDMQESSPTVRPTCRKWRLLGHRRWWMV